jgi:dynein heavy chain
VDEYDQEFTRMRDESQKSKQAKMTDDLEKAKHMVEECKRLLAEKKKQVEVWRNRVDRSCIERVRAFQNPPALIGQIMEMIVVLIGRRKFPENTFVLKSDLALSSQAAAATASVRDDKSIATSENSKQIKPSKFWAFIKYFGDNQLFIKRKKSILF